MANLSYVTSNRLTEESNNIQYRKRKVVLYAGVPSALAAFMYSTPLGWIVLIVAAVLFIGQKGDDVIASGANGEDVTLDLLKRLPDTYTIFNQVDIPSEKSRTGVVEADLVVVGQNAIFVIEVKHNNGEIMCDESNHQWSITKTGRGGSQYGKEMRNPVKQVKNQVWLLGEYLKTQKAKPWIQPIVLFSHPAVSLCRSKDHSVPVLTASELLAACRA
jgi:hypothetical protein